MKIPKARSSKPRKYAANKPNYTDVTDKEGLRALIWQYHGVVSLVCAHLDISYCQFYQAARRWDLMEDLKKAKEMLLDKAKSVLFDSLDSKSESTRLRAAETVMRHSSPPPFQEVTIKEGEKEIEIRQIFGISDE